MRRQIAIPVFRPGRARMHVVLRAGFVMGLGFSVQGLLPRNSSSCYRGANRFGLSKCAAGW